MKFLRENIIFLLPFIVIFTICLAFSLCVDKIELHSALMSKGNTIVDYSMRCITLIGSNIPFIIGGIVLLFHIRRGVYILSAQGIATIIVQPLKHIVRAPRPLVVFQNAGLEVQHVDGIALHHSLSFPSGHSAAAFALMFTIAVLCKNKTIKALCLVAAIAAAYSRIYLSQHFMIDTTIGALIGVISVALIYHPMTLDWGNYSAFHNILPNNSAK